jgi:hypothetical protein
MANDDNEPDDDFFEICISEFVLHELHRAAARASYDDKARRPPHGRQPPREPDRRRR